MIETSITVSFLKVLWNTFENSWIYSFVLSVISFFVSSYNCSLLKRIILDCGNFEKYTESSLFYNLLSVIISFVLSVVRAITGFVSTIFDGSIIKKTYINWFKSSSVFSFEGFFSLCIVGMFLVPHDYWNNMYALLIALFLCVIYAFGVSQKSVPFGTNFKKVPFQLLFFIFAVSLSVLVSHDMIDSIRIFVFFATSFILCLLVFSFLRNKDVLEKFMHISYIVLIAMSLLGIVQRVLGVEADASLTDLTLNKGMPGRVFGTLGNPNNFAEYLMIFIPFGFAYSFSRKTKDTAFVCTLMMALPIGAILLTYSRSGWIALAAAVVVYIALYNYKLFPALFATIFVALPFIPSSIYNRILTIGNVSDSSSSYRINIWTGCLDMLKDFWFTGIGLGPGSFANVFPKYALGETTVVMHSHMQFMEMMVEGGVLLFIAYVWLLASVIKRACVASTNISDSSLKHYMVASAASVTGISLIGLFEYCWFYPRVMFAFFIGLGICLSLIRLVNNCNNKE